MTSPSPTDCAGEKALALRVHEIAWPDGAVTYEVRKPGRGTADDWELGECVGVFFTRAEADAEVASLRDCAGEKALGGDSSSRDGQTLTGGAQFTPGPWAVDPELHDSDFGALQRDGTRAQLRQYIHAPEGGGGRIGACFANCLVTTDAELLANARLIAAAPELFEALDWLVQILPDPELDNDELQRTWTKKARAAIAKATGAKE
jgi:hypothetical protein